MTRKQIIESINCDHCGEELRCSSCGGSISSRDNFSKWMRSLAGSLDSEHVDLNDIDFVWFRYRQGWFITIEAKQFNGSRTQAQEDTQNIIRQMLFSASGGDVDTLRGRRPIRYGGHFVIVFEHTTPDDGWFTIDGKPKTKEDLLQLLMYGVL